MLAKTVGAVRQITVERGHDPRVFSLLAFGGAGPLVAPLLALEMGMAEVIVPFAPSGFSAWGMLTADIVHDSSRTVMAALDEIDPGDLEGILDGLAGEARSALAEQGVDSADMAEQRYLDLRYTGQEHTLSVSVVGDVNRDQLREAFNAAHRARYGHAMDNPVHVLTARVRGIGRTTPPDLPVLPPATDDVSRAMLASRSAFDFGTRRMQSFAVADRSLLCAGDQLSGPVLVDEGTSTTVVHSGQVVVVDEHGYLLITRDGGAA
jgi:N-methylhydantoinase A